MKIVRAKPNGNLYMYIAHLFFRVKIKMGIKWEKEKSDRNTQKPKPHQSPPKHY